jgi:Tfp pilus assembly protein PilF
MPTTAAGWTGLRPTTPGWDRLSTAGTHLAYAELLVEQGRKDEAIRQLSRSFRIGRGDYRDVARARELRGVLLMEKGATTQGLADLRLACAIQPGLAPAWGDLASALDRMGDERGAEEAHRKAIALRPKDPVVLRSAGRFLLARRRGEEAADLLERACAAEPADAACLSDLGTAWVQARRLDRARAVFERILSRQPAHLIALATLGSIEESEGRGAGAADLYERYLAAARRRMH